MTRPTTDGWLAGLGATALGAIALWSGNNALLFIVSPLGAVWLLAAGLGGWNVRGLRVTRRWPDELVAGREARGALCVRKARGPAFDLHVEDEATGASVRLAEVRDAVTTPCRWRFATRGPTAVTGFVVRSTWPFGLWWHEVRLAASDTVLVGVRPRPVGLRPEAWVGDGEPGQRGRTGTGDLVGLRPYVPGDPLRRVHWPTSARMGEPIVVERTEDAQRAVVVRVQPKADGEAWERELSEAAGQIQRGFRLGLRVGLALPPMADDEPVVHPARTGEGWRRHLLDVLARLPRVAS